MRETVKILVLAGAALLLFLPPAAARIVGDCNDCHSESAAESTIGDLWQGDCVGCHALGTDERIVTLPGGTQVPQVYHTDPVGDLAAGNFAYISGAKSGIGPGSSRKGHDVNDLSFAWPDELIFPPGFVHSDKPVYFRHGLTCAGVNGCHGVRNQLMPGPDGILLPRVGTAALQGVHHANEDGRLALADTVANSYRFLMGVYGLENTFAPDHYRWQNVNSVHHNEYYGFPFELDEKQCWTCHRESTQANPYSYITTPGHSMTGFCFTCHSNFHEKQGGGGLAFLRHPADFVIPDKDEYAAYLTYEITAPVARPEVPPVPSPIVQPGRDLVMCLSCHMAHASPFDGLLRFDYTRMFAGDAGDLARTGCFACHTSKGR